MKTAEDRVRASLLVRTAGRLAASLLLQQSDKIVAVSVEGGSCPAEEQRRHPVRVTTL